MDIEIWSDVVCPWCYLGKRRFEHALQRFEHKDEVTVQWRSFQLDPTTPRGLDQPVKEWLKKKLRVDDARLRQMHAHLESLAAAEGLRYDLGATRTANTLDAHRLLHLARSQGREAAAMERLFQAQFSEGKCLDKRETLLALMEEIGVSPQDGAAVLDGDRFAAEVQQEIRTGHELGIDGVPCFVLDRRSAISGAQDTEVMLRVLRQAWSKRAA